MRTVARHVGAVVLFSLPAVGLFGHAWAGHLDSTATCACGDAGQQIWFMAWPAYALAHGHNPFFSAAVWAPHGANLLDNSSFPLVGLVFAPVTWLWGPVVSTNVALTLAPGLSAWGAWFACRRLVGRSWPAVLGGLLFGYSPFVVASLRQGHLGLAMLVFLPLMLVVVDAIVRPGRQAAWRAGVGLGALVVAQGLVSAEVLVMACCTAAVGLVATVALAPRAVTRARVVRVGTGLGVALAVAVAGLAGPEIFAVRGPRHIAGPVWPGLDQFGNRVDDLWRGVGPAAAREAARFSPPGHSLAALGVTDPGLAYVGVALLVLAALSLAVARRRRFVWVVAVAGVSAWVLSLGAAAFRTDALRAVPWLPWQALVSLPVLDDVLPARFALFVDLAVAVVVAAGADELRRRVPTGRRGGEPLLAAAVLAAALVPVWVRYDVPLTTEQVTMPAWFATTALGVPSGSVVLTYPFPSSASLASEPMIWQAVDGMAFRLAGGYLKVPGPRGRPLGTGAPGSATSVLDLLTLIRLAPGTWAPTAADIAALRSALGHWDVSYVVATRRGPNVTQFLEVMEAVIGKGPTSSHGAWVWDVRVGQPSGVGKNRW